MIRSMVSIAILSVFLVGCGGDNGTGPEEGLTRVTIGFTAGSAAAQTSGAYVSASMSSAVGLVISGSNGVLTLTDVRMLLAEFELEKVSGSCVFASDCHDFDAPPSFLKLPLDGGIVTVATSDVPAGAYDELEFEVEDLEDDEEDDDAEAIAALRALIVAEFSDWPDKASMLVVGTFQEDGGALTEFRVYFDAEIEIEIDLFPRLEITEEGDANRTLTVDVQPDLWFRGGAEVLDLSLFDWDVTGQLLDFEFELEDGFAEIEIG